MRALVLIMSLLLMPDEARACAQAKETFHQLLGFSAKSSDAVFLDGAVVRSPGGCVTHSLALVAFAPDGSERSRSPLPADLLASLGVVDARQCSTDEPTRVSPMPSASAIVETVRKTAFLGELSGPIEPERDLAVRLKLISGRPGSTEIVDPRTERTLQVQVEFSEGGLLRQAFLVPRATSPRASLSPERTRLFVDWEAGNLGHAGHASSVHQTEMVILTESCRRPRSRAECDRPAPFTRRDTP